jgi:putative heme-binding domain-containing protein
MYGSRLPLLRFAESPGISISLRATVVSALVPIDLFQAAQCAANVLARAGDDADVDTMLATFLKHKNGAEVLANALVGNPPSFRAAQIGLRVMSASGRRNELLANVLARAAGLRMQNSTMTAKEVAAFADEVRSRGNAARGVEVFERPQLGCIACHAVNGKGGSIGPNLSALGSAQPIDFIVGAILDPQKEIKEGYTSISVTTKDGEEYQGYQLRETGDELVLRDVLQNKEVRLRRGTIQEKRQNGSVMPSGLADTLTRDEFRDLVRYLSELGRTK